MIRVLSLNLQHGLPGAGAGDGSAATGSLAGADISDPATARAVMRATAEQIAELAPDVIALQEVDLGQARSGRLHQAAFLAEELGMPTCRFAASYAGPAVGLRRRPLRSALSSPTDDVLGLLRAAVGAGPIGYGNALISRFPAAGWHIKRLGRGPSSIVKRGERAWDPRSYKVFTASSRVMVAATLDLPEDVAGPVRQLSVASTHLATRGSMAARQLAAAWEALAGLPGPHLLVGDYNLGAEQVAALGLGRTVGEGATFPAAGPTRRIDHVLTDLWPTGPDGLPLTDEAAVAAAGAAGDGETGSPLLRAVDWGTASFVISDHVGTWVDLEPVG
ncbi:endonuclease/exonuclease/phosphatase family protein [Actinomyces sp. Marseille-P3109]|uniref:endonuclease/exonuclease/phosphatase family protein n=1 Tax=Actinomyces sp. Marseille-P3109 TaxID=2083009 RepID=UPI000D55D893|nr:endonuclease/exonuclease/phosphatase family protein [Actinomyces sp. Marseille-P3109]